MVQCQKSATGSLVLTVWLMWATLAVAKETVLVDFSATREPVPPGWELTVNTGEAALQLVQDNGRQALQMRSEQASYALQKKFTIPLQSAPYIVWQWKVTALPSRGDFRKSGTDDQAAQLIVAFSSTRFLTYIWDSTAPKGLIAAAPAPLFKKIFAVVMQSGSQGLGNWITERRNLINDYKQAYGEDPEVLEGLRIQINSQHTQSRAEAYWQSIMMTAKP
ncbi:MAG: DUF3047 domain-containing protein [Candidatus Tectimicrobiota bacterium]